MNQKLLEAEMDHEKNVQVMIGQVLEERGVLGKIKAELRAAVFTALDEKEKKTGVYLENQRLSHFKDNAYANEAFDLIKEFFSFLDLDFSMQVLCPEANIAENNPRRDDLSTRVNLGHVSNDRPLLLELIEAHRRTAMNNRPSSMNNRKAPYTASTVPRPSTYHGLYGDDDDEDEFSFPSLPLTPANHLQVDNDILPPEEPSLVFPVKQITPLEDGPVEIQHSSDDEIEDLSFSEPIEDVPAQDPPKTLSKKPSGLLPSLTNRPSALPSVKSLPPVKSSQAAPPADTSFEDEEEADEKNFRRLDEIDAKLAALMQPQDESPNSSFEGDSFENDEIEDVAEEVEEVDLDEAEALQVEESLSDHSQSSALSNYDYVEDIDGNKSFEFSLEDDDDDLF